MRTRVWTLRYGGEGDPPAGWGLYQLPPSITDPSADPFAAEIAAVTAAAAAKVQKPTLNPKP
jgi:hypothetical protein